MYKLHVILTILFLAFYHSKGQDRTTKSRTNGVTKQGIQNSAKINVNLVDAYSNADQVRSLQINPTHINVIILGQSSSFTYDPKDNTTPDNGGTVITTKKGGRYKRVLDGPINAQQHFGAKGDGISDDTQALQAAINASCKANSPSNRGTSSPSNVTNTVYIPHGIYKITDEILIKGSCTILMEQASSYGGTRIQQNKAGKHLFHIVKDNDGSSSGVHFIGGILKGGVSSSGSGIALIYGGESIADANNNSTYIENVWFQTPEQYGINLLRGDDLQIRNCTFDVSAYHSIKLGSSKNVVTNSSVDGCTFYGIRAGVIDLINVDALTISGNRVYFSEKERTPYFINANGVDIKGLQVINNNLNYIDRLIFINHNARDIQITNNMHRHCIGRSIELGGGQTISTVYITNNVISGDFSGFLKSTPNVPDAPVFGYSTGLNNSRVTGNSFRHDGTKKAITPILLTDSRVTGNAISDNFSTGFTDQGQVTNPKENRISDQ